MWTYVLFVQWDCWITRTDDLRLWRRQVTGRYDAAGGKALRISEVEALASAGDEIRQSFCAYEVLKACPENL